MQLLASTIPLHFMTRKASDINTNISENNKDGVNRHRPPVWGLHVYRNGGDATKDKNKHVNDCNTNNMPIN